MSEYDPTRLAVGSLDRFLERLETPKEPTPALVSLLKGSADNRAREAVPRIARAMEAKRAELINQPLARIWEELAAVAFAQMEKRPRSQEIQTGSPVGREFPNEDLMPVIIMNPPAP